MIGLAGSLMKKTCPQLWVRTTLFNQVLIELKIPKQCWAAVIYNYWISGPSFAQMDVERLVSDIRSRKLLSRRGFGKLRLGLMRQWLAEREGTWEKRLESLRVIPPGQRWEPPQLP